jgi:hypothetical protein
MKLKLNQIIAIEKGIKSRTYSEITELNKKLQKEELFNGFSKTYRKLDEEGEEYPPESKKVQLNVNEILNDVSKCMIELFDTTFTKDYNNCFASANIKIDGNTIIEKAPATFILFLEKQLNDIKTIINNIPVLDSNEDWKLDENSNLYKSNLVSTHKSKKVIEAITLTKATKEHPEQAQLINKDVLVGYWDTIKQSGAMTKPHKKELIEKVEKLIDSVKIAREEANNTEIEKYQVSNKIFEYLLK